VNVVKELTDAHRVLDIAKERGLSLRETLMYDIIPRTSLLETTGATTKPNKSELLSELTSLVDVVTDNYLHKPFPQAENLMTGVVVDIMNQIRKISTKDLKTIGDLLSTLVANVQKVCKYDRMDFVFDSYLTKSIKLGERQRREYMKAVTLPSLSRNTALPVQMETFWASSENKAMLQNVLREYILDTFVASKCTMFLCGLMLENGPTSA